MVVPYTYIDDPSQVDEGHVTTRCKSIYEFYKLPPGKKALSMDNLIIDTERQYLIYSGFSERYYIRKMKEKDLEGLKYDVEMGTVHLLWTPEQQEDIKTAMRATYRHYRRTEGSFTYYGQYIPLIENTVLYALYRSHSKDNLGYYTRCRQYEQERLKLINL